MAEQTVNEILRPEAGQNIVIPVEAEQAAINLGFDINDATLDVRDGNLHISFADGSSITLEGMVAAAAEEGSAPVIYSAGETIPTHPLLVSLGVSEEDFATAAGGAGAGSANSGGSGEYGDDAGVLWDGFNALGRVDVAFDPAARPWIRSEGAEDLNANLDFGTGNGLNEDGSSAPFLRAGNYNESDGIFYLSLNLDRPAAANITITFQVGGSAAVLQNLGLANEYRSDISMADGVGVSYDPATGLLTVIIPQGVQRVDVPILLVDDHISDGAKDITFTIVDVDGPINSTIIGQEASAHVSEDYLDADGDGISEHGELDGPIVALHSEVPAGMYEGSGENKFEFSLSLTDPHTGNPYNGFQGLDGSYSGVMSQDTVITLNIGGSADAGSATNGGNADYHLEISKELYDLIQAGQVTIQPGVTVETVNGQTVYTITVPAGGELTVTLTGMVDANGNLNSAPAFDLSNTGLLSFTGVVHINSETVDNNAQENAENITIDLTGVKGNESSLDASNNSAKVELEADPVLSLKVTQDGKEVNESEAGFGVQLVFDKPVADGVTFTATIGVGGKATLWDGDPDTLYQADFFLPGYPGAYDAATNSTTIQINGVDVTFTNNGDGTITITGDAAAFDASGNLNFDFPLNDDHITEREPESVEFAVEQVILSDGTYSGTVGTGDGDKIDIIEDNIQADGDGNREIYEKDGPVVGVELVEVNGQPVSDKYNGETSENIADYGKTPESGSILVGITLSDQHTYTEGSDGLPSQGKDPYSGYEGNNLMSQDTTITINIAYGSKVDGEISLDDFEFDFSAIEALGLSVGNVYVGKDGQWCFDIEIPEGFDLSTLYAGGSNQLVFGITMKNDDFSETAQNLSIYMTTDGNNESVASNEKVNIDIDDGAQTGPVLSLVTQDSDESLVADPANSPADPSVLHTVSFNGATASEPISMKITLADASGTGTASLNGGLAPDRAKGETWDDGADYAFNGTLQYQDANGVWHDLAYTYNNGVIEFTAPAGATEVRFGVTIHDDMRETSEGGESYNVKLELVAGDNGLVGSEATLEGNASSISKNPVISPDERDALGPDGEGSELNPYYFDGPYVAIAATDPVDENGNRLYNESEEGNINFQVSLTDPSGSNAPFTGTEEEVNVTIQFNADTSLTFSDLAAPGTDGVCNFTIRVTFNTDPASYQDIPVSGNAWDSVNGYQIVVVMPEGASSASFSIPVNDDPLGASSSSEAGTSLVENASEQFSLEIVKLEGNEARADNAAGRPTETGKVTIVDDELDDPGTTEDDVNLEGVGLGLNWAGGKSDFDLAEGNTAHLYVTVSLPVDGNGNEYNPYAGYTQHGGMPEATVLTFSFSDTLGKDDVTLTVAANGMLELIKSGKVTVDCYINGQPVTISAANLNTYSKIAIDLDQPISVTVAAGTSLDDLANVSFQVAGNADNVSEWDKLINYLEDTYDAEEFGMSLTSVDGNETYIATNADGKQTNTVTGHVTDAADGALTWGDESGTYLGTGWGFTINVGYSDKESATASNVPGEAVHMQVNIGNTKSMQNGEEFSVDAYQLFLSLNAGNDKLADFMADNGITDLPSYMAWLDKADGAADGNIGGDYSALLAACEVSGVILVYGDDSQWSSDPEANVTYDIYVPKSEFADGNISFDIATGPTSSGAQGGFAISLVDPYTDGHHAVNGRPLGEPEFDMKGEIVYVDSNSPVVEAPKDKIVMSLTGTKQMNEDEDMGAEGSNQAAYNVAFAMYDKNGDATPSTAVAGNISFDLTVIPKSGVYFDNDLADNANLDNWVGGTADKGGHGTGDFGILVYEYTMNADGTPVLSASGQPIPVLDANDEQVQYMYSSLDDLMTMLNVHYSYLYGTDANGDNLLEVTNIALVNGEVKISFTAKEGFDLGAGVELIFQAQDDSINDNSENFSVVLSNVSSSSTDQAGLDVAINSQRKDTTQIIDETSGHNAIRNGYAISLVDSEGFEASITGGSNVYVTVNAHALDDETNTPLSLSELTTRYNNAVKAGEIADGMTLVQFIDTYFAPTQSITVTYGLGGADDGTTATQDYVVSTSHTIPASAWELKLNEDGSVYTDENGNIVFEAAGTNGIPIETIKDYLSEGMEDLSISLSGTSGNESRLYGSAKDEDGKAIDPAGPTTSANVDVLDVHDGPAIISFGPEGGFVYEPIDKNHTDGDNSMVNKAVYTVKLDQAVTEDVVVWIEDNSTAGDADYYFGSGVYGYNTQTGQVTIFNDDGTSRVFEGTLEQFLVSIGVSGDYVDVTGKTGSLYFTVVEAGQASASFNVMIRDDNDESAVAGGADDAKNPGEDIILSIVDVQGGEVMRQQDYNNPDSPLVPWDSSASYEYSYTENGVTYKGIVTPATDTAAASFTLYVNGKYQATYEYGDADSPDWLPGTPPATSGGLVAQNTIIDEMEGPGVGATGYSWTLAEGGPYVDVAIQDVTGETVTVYFEVTNMNGDVIGTIKYELDSTPEGSLTGTADIAKLAQEQGVTLPGGDFYIQIVNVVGGEAVGDSTPLFLDAPGTGGKPVPYIDNFESEAVKEGEYVGYDFDLVVPVGSTWNSEISFVITTKNGSAGDDDYSSQDLLVTITPNAITNILNTIGVTPETYHFSIGADENGNPKVDLSVTVGGTTISLGDLIDNSNLPQFVKDILNNALDNAVNNFISVTDTNGDPVTMPQADTDLIVEGTEEFHSIITNPSGVDLADPVATTPIIDQTFMTVVLMVPDGKGGYTPLNDQSYPENHGDIEVVAQIVLANPDGTPVTDAAGNYTLVTATEPLQFAINYNTGGNDTADSGADYTGEQTVYIQPGQSTSNPITITVHEDYVTEDNETFTVGVTLAGYDENGNYDSSNPTTDNSMANQFIPNSDVATVTIEEVINGPVMKWGDSHSGYSNANTNMNEGGSGHTVYFGSYSNENTSVRQVVEEDVTLTFELTPTGDTNMAEDIASITLTGLDGQKYTFTFDSNGNPVADDPAGAAAAGVGVSYDNGVYTITTVLNEGDAMGSFIIKPKDDVKTELNDTFTLELVKTEGGETSVADGWDKAQTITIKDDSDGYKVTVEPDHGVEGDYAGVLVKLTGGSAPEEDVQFNFTVTDSENLISESGVIKITLPNGDIVEHDVVSNTIVSYNGNTDANSFPANLVVSWDNGVLSMTVPQDQMALASGQQGIKVEFPIMDNSTIDPTRTFDVVVDYSGGEMGPGSTPSYTSSFDGENQPSATHGGQTLLSADNTGGSVSSVVGTNTLTFSGGSDLSVVDSITINGETYDSSSTGWTVKTDAQGNTTSISIAGVDIANGYDITVTYAKDADSGAVADVKTKLDVSVTVKASAGTTVEVEDNTDGTAGPVVSMETPYSTTVDGQQITFINEGADKSHVSNLVVKLPQQEGDGNSLAEDITVSFQLTGKNPDGSWPEVYINGERVPVASNGSLSYTVKAEDYQVTNGTISLPISMQAKDNAIVGDYSTTLSITGVSAATVYETSATIDPDANSGKVTVSGDIDPADKTGPSWNVNASDVSEGTQMAFTISSSGTGWNEVANNTPVTVTFEVNGLLPGESVWFNGQQLTADANGEYSLTMFKGQTPVVSVRTENTDVLDARDITLTVTGDNVFEANTGADKTASTIDVNDGIEMTLTADRENGAINYSIALAAAAGLLPNGYLPEDMTFNLNLDGMSEPMKLSVASDLNDPASGISAEVVNGVVVVTLTGGTDADSFKLDGGGNASLNFMVVPGTTDVEVYTVSVTDANGGALALTTPDPVQTIVDMTLTGTDGQANVLVGGDGNDAIIGGDGDDLLMGDDGNDTIIGGAGKNILFGGDGDDTLVAGDDGNLLMGGAGNDTLTGGAGDDVLVAGSGSNTLTGGAGDDVFMFTAGSADEGTVNTITDFGNGNDTIDLSGLLGALNQGDYNLSTADDGTNDILINILNGTDTYQTIRVEQNQDQSLTTGAVEAAITTDPTASNQALLNVLSEEVDNEAMDNMLTNLLGESSGDPIQSASQRVADQVVLAEGPDVVEELQQNLQNINDILSNNN